MSVIKAGRTKATPAAVGGRALSRGLEVLETLIEAGQPLHLTELARRTELPKATVHRLLRVLQLRGYVQQDQSQSYLPSYRLLGLAHRIQQSADNVQVATPIMRALQQEIPETVHFAVLHGDVAVYAQKLDGIRPYRMSSAVGLPLDLHTTAIGKAILAHLSDDALDAWLSPRDLSRHTSSTLTSPAALRTELDVVRSRGFAIDNEEDEDDVRCLGAAVFDHRGQVMGGVSVSAPAFKLPLEEAMALGPTIVKTAADLSLALGAPPEVLPDTYRDRLSVRVLPQPRRWRRVPERAREERTRPLG